MRLLVANGDCLCSIKFVYLVFYCRYRDMVDKNFETIDDWTVRLSRQIKDLDDVRETMAALKEIREKEIEMDMSLGPIEEAYAISQRMSIPVPQEEIDRVDTMRYAWQKLLQQGKDMQDHLLSIQDEFRERLTSNVEVFTTDVSSYMTNYTQVRTGLVPMLP